MNTSAVIDERILCCAEHFSARDERVENMHSNYSPTKVHITKDFQSKHLKIATQRYSPSKTGGSYRSLILTSEHTSLTSYTGNRLLCWIKQPSSILCSKRKRKTNFSLHSEQPVLHVLSGPGVTWLFMPCLHNYWVKIRRAYAWEHEAT